jgi:MFS family permease
MMAAARVLPPLSCVDLKRGSMSDTTIDLPLQSTGAQALVAKHLRRNVTSLTIDSGTFGMALGYMGYSTVLPYLAFKLTNAEPLVGFITTLWIGMWLLPQLPAGRWMAGRPHKKPILLVAAVVGRAAVALFALALALQFQSALLFLLLVIAVIIFRGLDAIAAVAWFDIISKTLPPKIRGRILGMTQSAAFIMEFLASFVVAWSLSQSGPTFPGNYALLFGLAAICLMISFVALTFLREPAGEVANNASSQMKIAAHVLHILRNDTAFRQAAVARTLIGFNALALPFYVEHATHYLQIPPDSIGLFLAAQTLGGVLSSGVLGAISSRRGAAAIVKISMVLAMLPPLLAVLLHVIGVGNAGLATVGYAIVFALMGATDASFLLGFLAYVLDIAPPSERTAYMGLANTIAGLLVIIPTIGGVLLSLTSFPVLFVATGIGPLLGFFVALRLPRANPIEA